MAIVAFLQKVSRRFSKLRHSQPSVNLSETKGDKKMKVKIVYEDKFDSVRILRTIIPMFAWFFVHLMA